MGRARGQVERAPPATRESVDAICSQCLPEIGVVVSGRNVVVLSAVKPRDAYRNGTDKQIKQKHSKVLRSSVCLARGVYKGQRCRDFVVHIRLTYISIAHSPE